MKTKMYLLFIVLPFILLPNTAWSIDSSTKGKIGDEFYQVNYTEESGTVHISMRDKQYSFKLTGYDVGQLYIGDINHDNNDEVIFLDLTGVSVGGELRIIAWNGESFEEVPDEYFASAIKIDRIGKHAYILLIQHDTQDLFYVSNVLELDKLSLSPSMEKSIWKKVIADYTTHIHSKIDDWKKSRYHAYISIAYNMLGNNRKSTYHFSKARQLDKNNPLLKK